MDKKLHILNFVSSVLYLHYNCCRTMMFWSCECFVLQAPHLRSNFPAATAPNTYHQIGKFSSLANPTCHVSPPTNHRPNTSTNYRPTGRVSNVNDRVLLGDNKFRSGQSEMSMEMTRGPRGHYNNFLLQPSLVKDALAITICRDEYNLSDFQTEYEIAKFYVIKSFNEDDVHKSAIKQLLLNIIYRILYYL